MEWWQILLTALGVAALLLVLSIVFYKQFFKRFWDVVLSLFALIVFSPLLCIIALISRIKLGKGVIFKQRRIGKGNKEFLLYKFRTMTNDRDENGVYLPDEMRITKYGAFLKKSSLDELPALWNILKADMSIIGPRPLPSRYLSRYTEEQKRRHEVRPGLSNPATTHGRNAQSWEDQLKRDVEYVDHISFFGDIKSILSTVIVVLSRKGATDTDGGARGEFIGTADVSSLTTDEEGNYMNIK